MATGAFGGTLTSSCGCDEIWCLMPQPGAGAGCLACMASGTVSWAKTGEKEWTGTQPWCLTDPAGVMTIVATYDCETDAFTRSATITAPGCDPDTFNESDFTETDRWCTDDAPEGQPQMPWFMGHFTVTPERAAANPCIYPGCGSGGCFGTGGCPTGIDACGCTGIPQSLTATVTAAGNACLCTVGQTVSLTHDGSDWTGSATIDMGPVGSCNPRSVTLRMYCDSGTWKLDFSGCDTVTGVVADSANCSPFQVVFSVNPLPNCCAMAPGNGVVVTVTV